MRLFALALLAVAFAVALEASGGERALASAAPRASSLVAPILMVPSILEGLLLGFGLIFFTILGVTCVMSIKTPDVLHSFHLPAGKEF